MHFLEYRHFFYCLLFTFLIFLFKTFETFLTSDCNYAVCRHRGVLVNHEDYYSGSNPSQPMCFCTRSAQKLWV